MSYVVYIIYSKKLDKFYVGHTEDVEVRLLQHNSGLSGYTAKVADWELKYTEYFLTREEARHRELAIKKKKSRKYIEWLISSGD